MDKMMSCKEAADMWNSTERWVSIMCKEGKIPGAVKQGHRWMLPVDSKRPVDNRIKSGAYRKEGTPASLPPALGVTDYKKACTEYFYVDKTYVIKEFLDNRPQVSLFLRPHCFGKTLFLDMLRVYFEKTMEDTSRYFLSKSIWSCGEAYRKHQGKYPVLFLSFRDLRFSTWKETEERLTMLIRNEYLRHPELQNSTLLPAADKALYIAVTEGKASSGELQSSLFSLCRMLEMHHGIAPVVLIDDYDTPFLASIRGGFQEHLLYAFQCLLTPVLRDNTHLSFGVLTGVRGLPSDFSPYDLPAPAVFDVTGRLFCSAFGFTEDETLRLCSYYNLDVRFDDINEWYGGYHFGNAILLHPWSVLQCIVNEGRIQTYRNLAGDVLLLRSLFQLASSGSMEHLQLLLQNRIIKGPVELSSRGTGTIESLRDCYGILVKEGYLNILMQKLRTNGVSVYEMLIPNLETLANVKREFLTYLNEKKIMAPSPASMIQDALYSRNAPHFQNALKQLLYQSIRSNPAPGDDYYQSLLSGLMVLTEDYYTVQINMQGKDTYVITMTQKSDFLPGVRIEISAGKTIKLLYSKPNTPQ